MDSNAIADLTADLKEPRPLSKARAFFYGRPSSDTMTRWIQKGIYGVRLKAVRVGKRYFVSQEAAQEFIGTLNPGEGSADA